MPYRSFRDSNGNDWAAWDVQPTAAERRVAERRVAMIQLGFPDRRVMERRLVSSRRALLSNGFGNGWLCFETKTERRRLTPIPGDWPRCDDRRLESYCAGAKPVPATSLRLNKQLGSP
jgi:hypothetical protein